MHRPLLAVHDLTVQYHSSSVVALERVSLTLARGEWLGVIGKSGSGKTTLARSILGLGARCCRTISGSVQFQGAEILGLRPSKLRRIRGRELALIAQEPELSLNPVLTAGEQISEVLRAHVPGASRVTKQRVQEMLAKVRLEDPAIFHSYPHQLSGGQRQRIVIAQALICKPALLIADEPTSALDLTTGGEIIALLRSLREELQLSLLLISHNQDLLRGATDRVMRMSEGRLTDDVVPAPIAPRFRPSPDIHPGLADEGGNLTTTVIEGRRLFKSYSRGGYLSAGRYRVSALAGASIRLLRGQTIALVGESGSGKSTLARCMALLERPEEGEIRVWGRDTSSLRGAELISIRRRIQLVFQHSASALNPCLSAEEIVGEPLRVRGVAKRQRSEAVLGLLDQVGLSTDWADRRPSQFSGGQRQRLAIARAMILNPEVVIFDEALAGLDVVTRTDILHLLLRLQASGPKSYVFITHDLGIAKELTDTILVMQNGKMTESTILSQSGSPDAAASAAASAFNA